MDLTWAPLTLNEFFSAVSDSRTRRGRVGVERRRGGRVARFRLSGRYQGHAEMQHLETVVQGAFSYLVSSVCCLSSSPPPHSNLSTLLLGGCRPTFFFLLGGWMEGGIPLLPWFTTTTTPPHPFALINLQEIAFLYVRLNLLGMTRCWAVCLPALMIVVISVLFSPSPPPPLTDLVYLFFLTSPS